MENNRHDNLVMILMANYITSVHSVSKMAAILSNPAYRHYSHYIIDCTHQTDDLSLQAVVTLGTGCEVYKYWDPQLSMGNIQHLSSWHITSCSGNLNS